MKVRIAPEKCIKCMGCLSICDVITSHNMDIVVDEDRAKEDCKNCKSPLCVKMCPTGAISIEK